MENMEILGIATKLGDATTIVSRDNPDENTSEVATPTTTSLLSPAKQKALTKKYEAITASANGSVFKPASANTQKPQAGKKRVSKHNQKSSAISSSPPVRVEAQAIKTADKVCWFENGLGKIRVAINDIIYANNGKSMLLVFPDESHASFIPKPGESLKLTTHTGEMHNIYYPGAVYTWLDDTTYLMLLWVIDDDSSK